MSVGDAPTRRIEKVRREHPVELFDCGIDELNRFLSRYALQTQQARGAQTYIGLVDGLWPFDAGVQTISRTVAQ